MLLALCQPEVPGMDTTMKQSAASLALNTLYVNDIFMQAASIANCGIRGHSGDRATTGRPEHHIQARGDQGGKHCSFQKFNQQ